MRELWAVDGDGLTVSSRLTGADRVHDDAGESLAKSVGAGDNWSREAICGDAEREHQADVAKGNPARYDVCRNRGCPVHHWSL